MKEITGDYWAIAPSYDVLVVTINKILKADHTLVMGAGIARDFAKKYTDVPRLFGAQVRANSKLPIVTNNGQILAGLYTKNDWRDPSDIKLIEQSVRELVKLVDHYKYKWVLMTRPGCGCGKLKWDDVKKVIAPLLDDRFHIIEQPNV